MKLIFRYTLLASILLTGQLTFAAAEEERPAERLRHNVPENPPPNINSNPKRRTINRVEGIEAYLIEEERRRLTILENLIRLLPDNTSRKEKTRITDRVKEIIDASMEVLCIPNMVLFFFINLPQISTINGKEMKDIINAIENTHFMERNNVLYHFHRFPQINTMSGKKIARIIEAIAKIPHISSCSNVVYHVRNLPQINTMSGEEIALIIEALGKIPLISSCNTAVYYVRNLPQINTMSGKEIALIIEAIAKIPYQFSVYYVFNLPQISTMSGEEIAHIINALGKIPHISSCGNIVYYHVRNLPQINTMNGETIELIIEAIWKIPHIQPNNISSQEAPSLVYQLYRSVVDHPLMLTGLKWLWLVTQSR